MDLFLTIVNRLSTQPVSFSDPALHGPLLEVFRMMTAVSPVLETSRGTPEYDAHAAALGGWRPAVDYDVSGCERALEQAAANFAGLAMKGGADKSAGGGISSSIGSAVKGLGGWMEGGGGVVGGGAAKAKATPCSQVFTFDYLSGTKARPAAEYVRVLRPRSRSLAPLLTLPLLSRAQVRGLDDRRHRRPDVHEQGRVQADREGGGSQAQAGQGGGRAGQGHRPARLPERGGQEEGGGGRPEV